MDLAWLTGLLATLATVFAAVVSFYAALLQQRASRRRIALSPKPEPPSLEQRLVDLSNLMAAGGRALEEVQAEIQARIALASKAKQDAEEAEQLAQLSEPQREALARLVRAEVSGEVNKNSRKSLWQQALLNFVFFVAGAAVSFLTTLWL